MDDVNDILILPPADKYGLAADAFRLPHNRDRFVAPSAIFCRAGKRRLTQGGSLTNDCKLSSLDKFNILEESKRFVLDFLGSPDEGHAVSDSSI